MAPVSSLKAGTLLVFALTAVVLCPVTVYLFGSSTTKVGYLGTASKLWPSLKEPFHSSTERSSDSQKSRKEVRSHSEQQGLWNGAVRDCSGSQEAKRDDKLTNTHCGDRLCAEYLSEVDMKAFFQCQGNASRRIKRFLSRQSSVGNESRQLVSCLNGTGSRDMIATGNCRFMKAEGVLCRCIV